MSTKRIMLILMTVLLCVVIVLVGIVIGRVARLFQPPAVVQNPTVSTQDTIPATIPSEPTVPTESSGPTEPSTEPPTEPPTEETQAHVHEYQLTDTIPATCTTLGYSLYACPCGKIDTRDFAEALSHKWVLEEPAEATCETDGYTVTICQRCKAEGKREVTTAFGHSFGEWTETIPATDTQPGERQRTCDICEKVEREEIPPLMAWVTSTLTGEDADWTHYVVQVTWSATQQIDTYSISIGLENRHIDLALTAEGLTVFYTFNERQEQYTLPFDADGVLAVDKDGNVSIDNPVTES